MKWLKGILDFLFYGNFWIALCAFALILQTEYLETHKLILTDYSLFVFFSTSFLYGIHRILGLKKLSSFLDKGRFVTINYRKTHILIISILAGAAAAWFYWQLDVKTKMGLLIPAVLSLGYVFPILGPYGRLRDLNYVKIFLIAFIWSAVTSTLPFIELGGTNHWFAALMFVERALFVFAITIPFDIRDYSIDSYSEVKTFPITLGIRKSIQLAAVLLIIMVALVFVQGYLGFYSSGAMVGLSLSAALTYFFILKSPEVTHDYYFTGLMDGTMILQAILTIFFAWFV
ncbi:MAG: hypothetical protein KDC24_04245 [Saprospiraceae bacterium]|nr:hypothetical protein [Saprospiraceae bacterium]